MQKSTVVFTAFLVIAVCLFYFKFGFSSSLPPTTSIESILDNKDKPDEDSSSTDKTSLKTNSPSKSKRNDNHPPSKNSQNNNNNNNDDHQGGQNEGDSEFSDPPLDDGKYSGPAIPPSPAGCIDVTHEETTNQVELTNRMRAFRPSSQMAKKIWGPETSVFAESMTEIPPIMKQWLFCYTKNYSALPEASENNDCTAELVDNAPTPVQNGKYFLGKGNLEKCTVSPVYQGNITSWESLSPILTQFPGPLKDQERSLTAIAESRSWYWKNSADPFALSCPTCRETKDLVHPTFLTGARRWWSAKRWIVLTKKKLTGGSGNNKNDKDDSVEGDTATNDNEKQTASNMNKKKLIADFSIQNAPYGCFAMVEDGFVTTIPTGAIGLCDGTIQPSVGDVFKWKFKLFFSQIVDFAFVFGDYENFFALTLFDEDSGKLETHLISPTIADRDSGVTAFWTSLQMLFGKDVTTKRDGNQRVLIMNNKDKTIIARNITDHYQKLRCSLRFLGAINVKEGTKMPPHPSNYDACWNDLISLKLDKKSGAAVVTPWNPKPFELAVDALSLKNKKDVSNNIKNEDNNDQDATSPSTSTSSLALSTTMAPTQLFTYLPCHPPYMTALVAHARAHGNMDSHGLYWPFSCKRVGNRRPCLDTKLAKMLRLKHQQRAPATDAEWKKVPPKNKLKMSDLVRPKVATCLAGFVRSFHLTRLSIFQNIIDPFDSDFFAATWNVQGRAKKTDPILKGHIISVQRMKQRIFNAVPKDRNVTELFESGRYAIHVYGYRMWEQYMKDVRISGFRHAGLYMLMSKALKMMIAQTERTGVPYDVVIRARFDLVPLVPVMIYPVWNTPDVERRSSLSLTNDETTTVEEDSSSKSKKKRSKKNKGGGSNDNNNNNNNDIRVPGWIVDTGSSCEMDGFWWPRTAVLREGVVVAHTADTRYKLFSWQYCDWLHIGTFNTMKKMSTLYDWTLDNYVDSGAQFVEHVWGIDQGIRFYPMQLYLKILRETRKKPRKNGKKVLKIRMHLFG